MDEFCEESVNFNDTESVSLLHHCQSVNCTCKPKYFVSSLNEFLEVLHDYEITTRSKFVLLSSYKRFSQGSVVVNNKMKILWEDGCPYFHFGTRLYGCHMGKDVNRCQKEKYRMRRDAEAIKNPHLMRYRRRKQSKKQGCPASIRVTRIVRMNEFKITGPMTTPFQRAKASRLIKKKINMNEPIGEECFMFNLPDVGAHKHHSTGADVALTEPIDQRVKDQIYNFVQSGERDSLVISKLLNAFVENELKVTDRLEKAYYPDMPVLRKFIRKSKRMLLKSKLDNKNTGAADQKMQLSETNPNPIFNTLENSTSELENFEGDSDYSITGNFEQNEEEIESESVEESNESLPENSEGGESNKPSNITEIKENLIKSCNSSIRLIQVIMKYINEEKLEKLSKNLDDLVSMFTNKVTTVKCTRYPVESNLPMDSNYGKLILEYKGASSECVGAAVNSVNNKTPSDISINEESVVENSSKLFEKEAQVCSRPAIDSPTRAESRNYGIVLYPYREEPCEIVKDSANTAGLDHKITTINKESKVNDLYNLCPSKIESTAKVLVKPALPDVRIGCRNTLLQYEEEAREIEAANSLTATEFLTSKTNTIVGSNILKRKQGSNIIVEKKRKDNLKPLSDLACLPDHSYHTQIS